jgi:hypothetical protein
MQPAGAGAPGTALDLTALLGLRRYWRTAMARNRSAASS